MMFVNTMRWCSHCGRAVEPEYKTESELHSEVDTNRYEEYNIPICPYCRQEVEVEANECSCGGWKSRDDDLCPDCLDACEEAYNLAIDHIMNVRPPQTRSSAEDIFYEYTTFCLEGR